MIKNYFKIAFRNLWRHKRMSAINIAGLGIGMAATVLIVLWVQNELSFDRYQPDAENIYRIKSNIAISKTETWIWETSQYILGDLATKQVPEIADLTRIKPGRNDINFHYGADVITESKYAHVDGRWFSLFHYDLVDGSFADFIGNPYSIILTRSAAKKYFGNREAVGQVLKMDSVNYQVRAVIKDNPDNSSFQYDLFMPIAAEFKDPDTKANDMDWGNYNYLTFVKLRPGTKAATVSAKLDQVLFENSKEKNKKNEKVYNLENLKDVHFESDLMNSAIPHGSRTMVNIFMGLACLLLITACINYVNLTTARASLRSKEVSVRKIVGASRSHLFGQFMSDSLVVSFIALVLALVMVQVSMPWFRNFTDKQFGEPLSSFTTWAIIGSILILSFLLNGLYPAALLTSFDPLSVFRGKGLLNFRDSGLRRMLVIFQFTVSIILITGTIVIYSQLQFIEKSDLGYDRSQVFSFNFPWFKLKGVDFKNYGDVVTTVKQQLKAQAVTSDVAMARSSFVDFTSQSSGSNFDWNGRPKDFTPAIAPLDADVDFKQLMQLKMKEGRWFSNEKPDQHNVVLNETAVAMLNIQKPVIGQRFVHKGDTGVVVGVVKDFHYRSLHEKIGPMVISDHPSNGFYVKVNAANTTAAIAAATKIWKQYFPGDPFNYQFLDDNYNNLYLSEQRSSVLITLFAVIAVFISALGLLGLAAFAAEQKVKEIGIRKVLGASAQHIVTLLSANFIKMVLVACVIALPVAWWAMNKWLQDFAYRISLSWWIFTASAAIGLLIALVTISYQAFKAAMANPVKSLRSE